MPKQSAPGKYTPEQLYPIFQQWLSDSVIGQLITEHLLAAKPKRGFYQRLFPTLVTLWGFISQRLNPDHTCDAFVSQMNLQAAVEAANTPLKTGQYRSQSTAGYCKARERLPLSIAQGVLQMTARILHAKCGQTGLWHGFAVNLFDGSTLRLAATNSLSQHFGVASNQHGRSHWPIMRLVVGFDLFSGAVWDVSEGPYVTSEHTLACSMIRRMGENFLHVGDRNFGVYHLLQVIHASNSQALLRLKVTQAKRLGKAGLRNGCDLDVVWSPSQYDTCEADLDTPAISGRLIYVRLTKPGFRPIDLYLFTTLTDREAYPVAEIIALYGQRWNVELDLRHVKTTLKMEMLDGKSVDIVRKELYLGLVAYNLIRGLMAEAALRVHRLPLELSLASCRRRIMAACNRLPATASCKDIQIALDSLLNLLGQCVLPKRKKERFEPRAVWGRPRVYPTIKGSRERARQEWLVSMSPNS